MFWRFISISLRSQMQYPISFTMLSISYFLGTLVDILGIWILFDRFKMVQGWTLPEVGLIYGIIHMGFALAESFSRGFDSFSQMVKQGEFDRLLLRPLSPLFQIAVREVQAMRLGRFLQGMIVLVWSAKTLALSLFSTHALVILFSILGTTFLFYGLFVIQATISFWTIETLELMNIATHGGVQTGQYPMSIYHRAFRWFFTLMIPLGCVGYYPIAILLRKETFPLEIALLFPLAGAIFLYCACKFWQFGVQHYRSTGN